ncbi:MAG: hypothetical protein [Lokiarchaeia virus VerdaV1]|uniref:Uncharacterized protein n=1 Tax=Lokiarchaeia virus VerdaV1 TaxID=3070170 RepID=A0AA35CNB6_9CAUD|nr:MAG: hypothetical protein QIT41_gp05 [Lokiarchaeia virus VerdaV1]BDI54854.1 MAG: hypothetical protein [Lokiarchaeia virus VerdaV1]
MPDEEEAPQEEDSDGQKERERGEGGKYKKTKPEEPKEKEEKEEPEGEITEISDEEIIEYFKKAQEKEKSYQQLLTFKQNRMKEIDDFEAKLKAQRTKEDQKLKGFKDEKKSEGDETIIPPLYKKMSFKDLTETSKKMRKK